MMGLPLILVALAAYTMPGVPRGSPPAAAQPADAAYQHSPVFAARSTATGYATVTIMRGVEVGPGRPVPGKGMKPKLIVASGPGPTRQPILAYEFE
jgi:hypothetical protein